MIPILMLYHEHDENPAMRPKAISPEQREKIIQYVAAGLLGAYRYFRSSRQCQDLSFLGWTRKCVRITPRKVSRPRLLHAGKCCNGEPECCDRVGECPLNAVNAVYPTNRTR